MLKRSTGTIGLIAALLLASPALAADYTVGGGSIKLGGSLRYDAGYRFTDHGDVALGAQDDRTDFFMQNAGNSRVNLAAGYKDLNAFVEMGVTGGDISTRHAYLSYNPNANDTLLIGRTWSILSESGPNQRLNGDLNLGGFGDLSSGRHDQIRYTHKLDSKLSFSVAIEDNVTSTLPDVPSSAVTAVTEPDFSYAAFQTNENSPALLFCLTATPSDKVTLTPSLMVERYRLERNAFTGDYGYTFDGVEASKTDIPFKNQTILSWAVALDGSIQLDPATFSFGLWGGENVSCYAGDLEARPAKKRTSFGAPLADLSGVALAIMNAKANGQTTTTANSIATVREINDTPSYGGWFEVAVPVDSKMTVFAGAGYQEAHPDGPAYMVEDKVSTWGAYANCEYKVKGGFSIQPEIAYLNYGNDVMKQGYATNADGVAIYGANDLGDDVFVGIHFQFDF